MIKKAKAAITLLQKGKAVSDPAKWCSHYQHLKRSGCSVGVKPVIVNPHWVEVIPNVWGVEAILLTMECKL